MYWLGAYLGGGTAVLPDEREEERENGAGGRKGERKKIRAHFLGQECGITSLNMERSDRSEI